MCICKTKKLLCKKLFVAMQSLWISICVLVDLVDLKKMSPLGDILQIQGCEDPQTMSCRWDKYIHDLKLMDLCSPLFHCANSVIQLGNWTPKKDLGNVTMLVSPRLSRHVFSLHFFLSRWTTLNTFVWTNLVN